MKITTKNENTKPPLPHSCSGPEILHGATVVIVEGGGCTAITNKAPPKRKEKKIKMKMEMVMKIIIRKL